MKKFRTGISLVLALLLLMQILPMSVFAASSTGANAYKNFVILGDSLCLGFSTEAASMADWDTYDIISNVYRAANGHNSKGEESFPFSHSYPTVFAKKIGIDTFKNNAEKYIFTPGDAYDDVYNFGICAAWAGDMYDMLSDPYYIYPYFSQNYDEDTIFVLPKDFVGTRNKIINAPGNTYGVSSEGYDAGKPSTWQYATVSNLGAEGFDPKDRTTWAVVPYTAGDTIDYIAYEFDWMTWSEGWVIHYKTERYSLPAGAKINVSENFYQVIMPAYYYVGKNCLDENGVIKDNNKNGKIDAGDYYYYPSNGWSCTASAEDRAKYGEPVENPQFTRYYYPYMSDKIENGDLIALACGGNDVYHSFMDQYMAASMMNEDGSMNILGALLYYINYAFQMNMTVGDILEILADPMMLGMLTGMGNMDWENMDFGSMDFGGGAGAEAGVAGAAGVAGLLASAISEESIAWLLDYYSSEKVTAFMEEEAIPNYKKDYEKCIQRLLEMMDPKAELVLMGHYNPFGIENYIQMMNMAMQNGEYEKHLQNIQGLGEGVVNLITSIIGSPEIFAQLASLTSAQLESQIAIDEAALEKLLNNSGLTDEAITQAIVDMSIPLVVLLMDEALGETYKQFNGFVEEMGEKYGLAYVDVSDAPCAGRYDPHPTANGHAWIADRLYETVLPTVSASVATEKTTDKCGNVISEISHGSIVPDGVKVDSDLASILRFRLRDKQTYTITADPGYYIQAIFIDGEKIFIADDPTFAVETDWHLKDIDKNEYGLIKAAYTFDEILSSHKIEVQFGEYDGPTVYSVEVPDSAATYSGAGVYREGVTVTLNAGKKAGYDFVGWQIEASDVKLDDYYKPQTTFTMVDEPVKVRALWEVSDVVEPEPAKEVDVKITVVDDREKEVRSNDLVVTFNTNGGSAIPPITAKEGDVIDLTGIIPTREGYKFGGWFSDPDFKTPITYIIANGEAKRMPIFAKWIAIEPVEPVKPGVEDCPKDETCPMSAFTDLNTRSWYHDGVHFCLDTGLMVGMSQDRFEPFTTLSRAMVVTILYRQMGCPSVTTRSTFKDVPDGQWFSDAIAWGDANGIILGYSADEFGPNDPVTREQLAAIMHRFARYIRTCKGETVTSFSLFDADNVSLWAVEDAKWAEAVGLYDGVVGFPLKGNESANRAEVAMALYNFCMRYI